MEGHGVLIAPRWVVTAAHAVAWQPGMEVVVVGGAPRAVEKVILHAGYRKLPQDIIDAALKSGDATDVIEASARAYLAALSNVIEGEPTALVPGPVSSVSRWT